jgi:hypothetical protein|tara:strand:+ start:218 stop:541 length:324 start_codon:yes stop_codon:yes gene_type:complete
MKTDPKTVEESVIRQVESWDTYARLAPTCFLIIAVGLISAGIIDFKMAFYVGIGIFAGTAVTWWFWTIYTIKHLVHTLNRASRNLEEVKTEFVTIVRDVESFKNDTK